MKESTNADQITLTKMTLKHEKEREKGENKYSCSMTETAAGKAV